MMVISCCRLYFSWLWAKQLTSDSATQWWHFQLYWCWFGDPREHRAVFSEILLVMFAWGEWKYLWSWPCPCVLMMIALHFENKRKQEVKNLVVVQVAKCVSSKSDLSTCHYTAYKQWRIWDMAGMARAMGATLTGGAKIVWKKLKSLCIVSWTSVLRPMPGTWRG